MNVGGGGARSRMEIDLGHSRLDSYRQDRAIQN